MSEIPECPSDKGHAWVTGKIDESGKMVSRKCRRCGYLDEFAEGGDTMSETTQQNRPTYKYDLLQEAKFVQEPVTEVEINNEWEESVIRVHAIQEYNGTAWRCLIEDGRGDGDPRVSFAKSYWDSDVDVLRDWSRLATGRLSGSQELPAWESLFAVFNAALGEYQREVTE